MEEARGVPADQMLLAAHHGWPTAAPHPSCGAWARRSTRSATRWLRASCILQLALSNISKVGQRRPQHLPQPLTTCRARCDVGPSGGCPATTGWPQFRGEHWSSVWGVDFEWIKKQYATPAMMTKNGITVSRWIDGVLENNELIDQDSNLRGVFYWGHAPTR